MPDATTTACHRDLRALVAPGGRVLVHGSVAVAAIADLVRAGHIVTVVHTDRAHLDDAARAGAAVAPLDLDAPGRSAPLLAAVGGRFETVVVGEALARTRRPEDLLAACAEVLEPAGVLLAVVPSGLAAAGAAPVSAVVAAADRAGWEVEHARTVVEGDDPPALAGTVLALRPPWTPDVLVRAGTLLEQAPAQADADVQVLVLGAVDPSQLLALRASLPERTTCALLDLDADLDPDQRVLVLTPDVLVQPAWLQALLAAHADHDVPVGLRLVDEAGRVVHAGAADDGAPFATGTTRADLPFLTVDRDATLLAPFVARVRDLATDGPVRGRYLGSHAARSLDPDAATPVGRQVDLAEVLPHAALVVCTESPRRLAPADRAGLESVLDALLAAGRTPVLRWEERSPVSTRTALAPLERRGVVLLGGSGAEGTTDDPLTHPAPPALVRALEPDLVVWGDPLASKRHHGLTLRAARVLPPSVLAADPADVREGARAADVVAPWRTPGLAERVVALLDADRTAPPRRVAVIAPRPRQAGVVTIVIPVWNAWDLTARCLDQITAHTTTPVEVIVVDNGSTDGTAAGLAERAARGELQVITNTENLGFPRACNQGMRAATGELVCILNNDTEVCAGWLDALRAALAVPGTGMVGPRSNLISGPQVVPHGPALERGPANVAAHAWAAGWTAERVRRTWTTPRLVGFCLLVRGDLLERLGGFDEGFGVGNYEDDDLCRRVLDAGLSLRVADGSMVLHHGGASFAALGESYGLVMREARRHFVPDEAHRRTGLVVAVVPSAGDPVAAARTALSVARHVDHVRVVERSGLAATRLAVSSVPADVEVVADDGDPLAGLDHRWVLVVEAGELFSLDDSDWGRLRAELEQAGAVQADHLAIGAPGGVEVRLTRGRDLSVIGRAATDPAVTTTVLSGVAVVADGPR